MVYILKVTWSSVNMLICKVSSIYLTAINNSDVMCLKLLDLDAVIKILSSKFTLI
jgi:hypothetical protein